jgi:hypothetical protein
VRIIFAAVVAITLQYGAPPANLPPPYPRAGADKLLDNAQVQVWNIAWLKGQPSALHRHIYDLVGVYYEPGDRIITSPEGETRHVSTKAWATTSQRAGLTHIEEGVTDAPLRAVFIEMKQAGPYGAADAAGTASPFTGEGGVQKLDNERATVWEYTQPPAARPHRHLHDTVVVVVDGQKPRALWVPKGTVHSDEGAPASARVYVFELK